MSFDLLLFLSFGVWGVGLGDGGFFSSLIFDF